MSCGMSTHRVSTGLAALLLLGLGTVGSLPAGADGGVGFTDASAALGIDYSRAFSLRNELREDLLETLIPEDEFFSSARLTDVTKPYGAPGVVLFDYDNDGDQDLFASNGPGRASSLYENQLVPTGSLSFVDVGVDAGVAATDHDSNGACAGDVDNDGHRDLYVTGAEGDANILFRNNGDGTFTDVTETAGVGEPSGLVAVACTFGDVDGDGFLDLFVSNNLESWDNRIFTFTHDDSGSVHNTLFKNQGDGTFVDVSAESGVEDLESGPPNGTWTWVSSLVDVDLDGDLDIVQDDMQGPASGDDPDRVRSASRLLVNDGDGNFTEVTSQVGLDIEGGWMGLAFADYDCNGFMDFFSSNLGNYFAGATVLPPSGWFLQQPDGSFEFTIGSTLERTPFGWGASPFDYDNDGDTDLIFHGGGDNFFQTTADNPGALLRNVDGCSADFIWDQEAGSEADHRLRSVEGVAIGDLDGDGFDDIVSVAAMRWTPNNGFFPYVGILVPPSDSPFDEVASFQLNFSTVPNPDFMTYVGPEYEEGDLVVELNSADNGNGWVQFDVMGSSGILSDGTVNRDGVGAVLSFTPDGFPTSMRPVVAGSSYASQNSSTIGFGLGSASRGSLEVFWPGGSRNRVYDVESGERVTVPLIPCSYDGDWANRGEYESCVNQALNGYLQADAISPAERNRLRSSAQRAFDESQCPVGMFQDSAYPDFCFGVRIGESGDTIPGTHASSCIDDAVCVGGALAGRSELFLRVLGPRPNGFLWPTIVRFTPSRVEVDLLQKSTGETQRYVLPAVEPGSEELPGLQDRNGFEP